jgi:hypothetical protein
MPQNPSPTLDRRAFLARTTRTLASLGVAGLALDRTAHAAGGDTIKLALTADKGVNLVAMGCGSTARAGRGRSAR